jgi:hypothetical protein
MLSTTINVLAGIGWDPQIRGFLTTAVGVVVLMGSVYLLVATNVGNRLGFFIASAAFWGWMLIMGLVWWVYGNVGMLGTPPKWEVTEVVYPGVQDALLPEAHDLNTDALPDPVTYNELEGADYDALRDEVEPTLGGWILLPESDKSFGEAKAAVDAYMVENPIEGLGIETASDYIATYSFEIGGKTALPRDPSRIERLTTRLRQTFLELRHPPHHAIVQVQPVVKVEPVPGEAPPLPVADDDLPVISVIMERNIGDTRFPGAMTTIGSGVMFGLTLSALHRRDKLAAERRGLLPATTKA